jgi:hypothetical protein
VKSNWIEMSKINRDSMDDDDILMQELIQAQND